MVFMMETEEKDIACFTLDGVVAEMVIEVEESQKSVLDDLGDLETSPDKRNENQETIEESIIKINAETIGNIQESVEIDADNEKAEEPEADKEEASEPEADESGTKEFEADDASKEFEENEVGTYELEAYEIEIEEPEVDEIIAKEPAADKEDEKEQEYSITSTTKEQEIKDEESTNQSIRRKQKKRNFDSFLSEINDSCGPRYPDRKRTANKKYISENNLISELISGERIKIENGNSKGAPKVAEGKKRKLDIDTKDVKIEIIDVLPRRNQTILSHIDESSVNFEENNVKQDALRKLPWRKNKSASDVPDFKPKVMWWNGVGEGQGIKLGHISGIKERVKQAKQLKTSRSLRTLFRILFFQWATEGQDLIDPILKFNGFPFDEMSYEFKKRRTMMKLMLDTALLSVGEILGLKKATKLDMIENILNFLLKPHGTIDVSQDPSLQPIVILEKLVLTIDETKIRKHECPQTKIKENFLDISYGRTTRNVASKKKEIEIPKVCTRNSSKISLDAVKCSPKVATPDIKKSRKTSLKIVKPTPSVEPEKSIVIHERLEEPKIQEVSSGKKKKNGVKSKTHKVIAPEKFKGVEKTKIVEKSKVVEKPKDVEKPKTAEKSKTVEKPKVTEKTKASEKPKAMEKAKAVEKTEAKGKSKLDETSKMEEGPNEDSSSSESESTSSSSDSETDINNLRKKIRKLKKEIKLKKNLKKLEKKKKMIAKKSKSKPKNSLKSALASSTKETPNEDKDDETVKFDLVPSVIEEDISEKDVPAPDDSSETESSDETKQAENLPDGSGSSRKVSKSLQRVVQPLRHFSQICSSIQKANFSALQRLHILLFGASDKAENLKTNILSFGGFPFLEGSDEWKQKHFLLSLLAHNNLREYLNLLCIEYNEDDQPAMINKLMRFLAAPSESGLSEEKTPVIETEVVSSELVNKSPPKIQAKSKSKAPAKKKKKEEPKPKRHRKVLMSEEEARRLEANFAREQRALARDKPVYDFHQFQKSAENITTKPDTFSKAVQFIHENVPPSTAIVPARQEIKLIPKPPMTDPSQLNALLQTVYKRRALKAAGAVISLPNKGERTKLGDIENVKFLVVTANYRDLELLHNLIFLQPANKGRVRKNILDFEGFNFNEDSERYKERITFLNVSGYDVSKRLSFLLGLCPLHTNIPQQDLNELIMYFLMTPCKTKQVVPITQMPEYPAEHEVNVLRTAPPAGLKTYGGASSKKTSISVPTTSPISETAYPKAKKSVSSSAKLSPLKKVLLSPRESPILQPGLNFKLPPGITAQKLPNSVSLNTVTNKSVNLVENLSAPVNTSGRTSIISPPKMQALNTVYKAPGTSLQVINPGSNVAVIDTTRKLPVSSVTSNAMLNLQNSGLLSQTPTFNNLQQKVLELPEPVKNLMKSSTGLTTAQEFIVQQQTPDGQQKTFKLIRLPPNHPLASAIKPPSQNSTTSSVPVISPQIITSNSLPTGIVVLKNSPVMQPSIQNMQNYVLNLPTSTTVTALSNTPTRMTANDNFVLSEEGQSTASNILDKSEVEVIRCSDDSPPTDDELFSSIQEIILSSNFEDITLRNVIERVSAQFFNHDLTARHTYMKECVKKIIIGTS